jgi:hypothetical protein
MAARRTYWMGAFPNRFETVVGPSDVEFYAATEGQPKPATAFVRIERLGLKGVGRRARAQMKSVMASAPKESWNAPDPNYIGLIWENSEREKPIGLWFLGSARPMLPSVATRRRSP